MFGTMPKGQDSQVIINVGGTMFTVDSSTIMNYPGTKLEMMLSERWNHAHFHQAPLFLDRDPALFRHILSFYRNRKIVIPCNITKSEMFAEVEFFGLPLEKKDIHYDMDSIDDIKKGFMDFEGIFAEKLKQTAHDGAVVACANELAALLVEKFRNSPAGTTKVFLEYLDIPSKSFAKVMFPQLLHDVVFRDCMQGIVEQGGYTIVVARDKLILARSQH